MKVSKNEKSVLDFLSKKATFVSPTEIGHIAGGLTKSGMTRHSSWASPICAKLVKKGLVERNESGHYKILEKERKDGKKF